MTADASRWGPLAAAILAGAGVVWGLAAPPAKPVAAGSPASSIPRAQTVALLGGLTAGDKLVGWRVRRVADPDDRGVIVVDIEHGQTAFSLMAAPTGSQSEQAPVTTERWSIYYGHVHPPGTELPRNVIRATTNALANRIRANE